MSLLVLLLVAQLVTQLDGVIAQGDTVEGRPKRSQHDELQQCLNSGVTDLNETNPFCGNQIARFLDFARNQPQSLTLPQDVIDGICSSTCYFNLSQIYLNCSGILIDVSDSFIASYHDMCIIL